jgi:hypothetical protein
MAAVRFGCYECPNRGEGVELTPTQGARIVEIAQSTGTPVTLEGRPGIHTLVEPNATPCTVAGHCRLTDVALQFVEMAQGCTLPNSITGAKPPLTQGLVDDLAVALVGSVGVSHPWNAPPAQTIVVNPNLL